MLSSALSSRRTQTFTDISQLELSDTNSLQEICYELPNFGVFLGEVAERPSNGWKSQLPGNYAMLKIEKFYSSRVVLHCYTIANPGTMYIATYNSNDSPSFKGWRKYTGESV